MDLVLDRVLDNLLHLYNLLCLDRVHLAKARLKALLDSKIHPVPLEVEVRLEILEATRHSEHQIPIPTSKFIILDIGQSFLLANFAVKPTTIFSKNMGAIY